MKKVLSIILCCVLTATASVSCGKISTVPAEEGTYETPGDDEQGGNEQGGNEQGGNEQGDKDFKDITIAEYNKLTAGDKTNYYMTGEISGTYHKEWGNFYLSDATGKVNIYGLLDTDGTEKVAYKKYGLEDGSTITILVNKAMWSTEHNDIVNAFYVSSDSGSGDSGNTGEGPEGDYEMKGICEVYAYNCGQAFDSSITDYDDWQLYLYNQSEEEFLVIEILTAANSGDTLPAGTYTVTFVEEDSDLHSGVCVAAFEDDDYVYGTFYGYGEYAWYYAEEGKVVISKSGNDYTIAANFYDMVEEANFSCNYTGPVTCYDTNEQYEAKATKTLKNCEKSETKTAKSRR